jgi:hypothetical protein
MTAIVFDLRAQEGKRSKNKSGRKPSVQGWLSFRRIVLVDI